MSKLFIELYFEQRMTGSESEFRNFFMALLDNSNDLDPEPLDISAKYNKNSSDNDHRDDYLYHVLTLTYEADNESPFRIKKKALESIRLIQKNVNVASFDLIKTKIE